MKNPLLLQRLPLATILTVQILLLVVNLHADTPEQCKYAFDEQNYACSVSCASSPQTCVPYCHLVGSNCTSGKEIVPSTTSAKALKVLNPGDGSKIQSSTTVQCSQIWDCATLPIQMAICKISGSTSVCWTASPSSNCFVCLKGAPQPPCTAPVDTLAGCQLDGG